MLRTGPESKVPRVRDLPVTKRQNLQRKARVHVIHGARPYRMSLCTPPPGVGVVCAHTYTAAAAAAAMLLRCSGLHPPGGGAHPLLALDEPAPAAGSGSAYVFRAQARRNSCAQIERYKLCPPSPPLQFPCRKLLVLPRHHCDPQSLLELRLL